MNRRITNLLMTTALAAGLALTSCVDREDPAMPTGYIPGQPGGNPNQPGNNPGSNPDDTPGKLPEFTKPETIKLTINGNEREYYKDSRIALTPALATTVPGYVVKGFTVNGTGKQLGELLAVEEGMRIKAYTAPTSLLTLSAAKTALAAATANDEINLEVTNLSSANISELGTAVKASKAKVHLIIPEGSTTQIPASSFAGCANLASVSLPASLIMVETNAFQNCTALRHVAFGGTGAFPLPGGVQNKTIDIPEEDFGKASDALFVSADINKTEYSLIPVRPGEGIYQLKNHYYKLINESNVWSFREIYYGDGVWWADSKISDPLEPGEISALTFLSQPQKEMVMLFSKAFAGCSAMETIILPDNISEISAETFSGCKNLAYVAIENRAIKVDDKAFVSIAEGAVVSVSGSIGTEGLNVLKNIFGPKNVVMICD